ncbi:SGNH/GDSL hydrolase family protein [Nocardioides seonyuensis]|uniref:SGNH/GDSL hydrolase family protein n=1 Tax=Nocardioides seonyuensis TaxID=2518371 RepID=A0A4P7IE49_9ACTN|nr:SGNH/GDSL hydrolase family protein [Nocardioides seonyuensis]QBX55466.1 SGNH/GDSL hydrolase family protein [Nocardioides seonyuensis]
MRRTLSAAGAAAATLCLSLLAPIPAGQAADSGHVPIWDNGPEGERYVALGDSFVAGPGILNPRPEPSPKACARSDHNFPTLVATELDVQSFIDASCSGARTTHFSNAQGANPPQLDAVTADTTLVTFGMMGGNDVGLIDLALSCVGAVCADPDGSVAARVEATRASLTAGIEAVKTRAPDAVVLAVGYGTYLPPGGCPATLPILDPAEADFLQGVIDSLSDVIEEVATAQGVPFVDMREIPGAADHTACAAPGDQWIRGLNTYGDGATLHPSTAGMAAMAGQVLSVLEPIWDASPIHPIAPGVLPLPSPEPSPTTAPSPAPPAAPAPVSQETLLAQAEAALDKVVTRSTCYTAKGARVVRFKARRGAGMIDRVVFRVGPKKVGTDRAAPFVVERRAARMAKLDGRVKARVTVRNGEVTASRMFKVRRAGCLH